MDMIIHHVEIGVQDGEAVLAKLANQFGFHLTCTRRTDFCRQWVVEKSRTRFLLTQANRRVPLRDFRKKCDTDEYVTSWCGSVESGSAHIVPNPPLLWQDGVDSAFNVALGVKDVQVCLDRVVRAGGTVLKPYRKLTDADGVVGLGVVKSCVGNVVHTLVNIDRYRGRFLPGFVPVRDLVNNIKQNNSESVGISHFDHVTFACHCGSSDSVLQWYEKCLGMSRFLVNRDEDAVEGFVVQSGDLGVRLKAFEYWRCAETGIQAGNSSTDGASAKFVIAESLYEKTPDQVNVFLQEHGGEGIQHIGLHTPDIINTVAHLQQNGVQFTEPPFTYYTRVGKLDEIVQIGEKAELLEKFGILIDSENDSQPGNIRYLMQKFTKPIFNHKTFFLEIIQRVGATGFGAGNITALWQSVQAYLNAKSDTSDNGMEENSVGMEKDVRLKTETVSGKAGSISEKVESSSGKLECLGTCDPGCPLALKSEKTECLPQL